MITDGIDMSRLLTELRATAAAAQGQVKTPGVSDVDGCSNVFKQEINGVNNTQKTAGNLAKAFEVENPDVSVSEVMIALQKANISFQAMTQVRNKLVAAYQEIMNMPI